MYALFHCAIHVSQTGGVKGRGADHSNATVRWSLHAFTAARISAEVFFVDIRSAYYTMIRELVIPVISSGEDLDHIVQSIGVPLQFVEPLKFLMQRPSVLEQHITDKHLLDIITSAHVGTWFEVPGADRIARTSTGCGPGRSLADLLHNAALLPAVSQIEQWLIDNELVFQSLLIFSGPSLMP